MATLIRVALRIFVLAAILRIIYPVLPNYLGWFQPISGDPTFDDSSQGSASEVYSRQSLTSKQCSSTFPVLEDEIESSLARGPFELERLPSSINGHVQARISNGKVGSSVFGCPF